MFSLQIKKIVFAAVVALLAAGCTVQESRHELTSSASDYDPIATLLDDTGEEVLRPVERMGYTIQVGAFAQLENAVRLERLLDARGLDAYYFRHESGLYKVRFGNHRDREIARAEAIVLQSSGVIGDFYIVAPEDFAAARLQRDKPDELRRELVRTARHFLGTPYRWGGTDREDGFDCSGLTMVCYRLNGLNLPRNSKAQFDSGRRIPRSKLLAGDLVFFATGGGRKVSHVGIYIGNDRFIHAPRTGQDVQIEDLTGDYYSRVFVGGRTYL